MATTKPRTGPVSAREVTAAIRASGVIGAQAYLHARKAGPGVFAVRMPLRTARSLTADTGWTMRWLSARLGVPAQVGPITPGRTWVTLTVTVYGGGVR